MRGLDRRIDIERNTATQDPSGQPIEGWAKTHLRRPAAYRPINGDERFTAAQFVARQQAEFRIRWDASVADLSPLDRVIYPASSVEESAVYDIMEVRELGRHEALAIMAVRRAEESA